MSDLPNRVTLCCLFFKLLVSAAAAKEKRGFWKHSKAVDDETVQN